MLLFFRSHDSDALVLPVSSVSLVGAYGDIAGKADILASDRFFTNSNYVINCAIKDDDGTTAKNVSGWTFSWILKKRATDPDASAVLTKTTANGGVTIVSASTGLVKVAIVPGDTDGSVKSGTCVHELKRIDAGYKIPLIHGLAVLRRSAHLS